MKWCLAKAEEAKAFATLSAEVQKHIRAEFDECMADVEGIFSKKNRTRGGDNFMYQTLNFERRRR